MKQHITIGQWHSLNTIGHGLWNGFCEQKKYPMPLSNGKIEYLPNIGQMIEFLEDNNKYNIYRNGLNQWTNKTPDDMGIFPEKTIFYKELCDCLWSAVKIALDETKTL